MDAYRLREETGQSPSEFLDRHLTGDWGEMDAHDSRLNDRALESGEDRIFSAYRTSTGEKLWVIIIWNQMSSATCPQPARSEQSRRAGADLATRPVMDKRVFVIDGRNFETLEEFYDEISNVLIPGARWGRNLDAFDDILCGGFGTPDEGFVIVWRHSTLSRERLGYPETLRQLEKRLQSCHPSNVPHVSQQLDAARESKGQTVFDWLVDIIRTDHEDVELRLE